MRSILTWQLSLFVMCCLLCVSHTAAAEAELPKHKNLVICVADDLGFQIGAYGDQQTITPHLDRLAAEGTRFTNAYCTTASCSASRSVIMSGLHNHATGHYGHAHSYNHFGTYSSVKSLPNLLNQAGYRTASIGKYHLAPESTYHFQTYLKANPRNAVAMSNVAEKWISQESDQPFFLYYCTTDPHRGPGPGLFANFNNKENPYPETKRILFDAEKMKVPSWLPENETTRQELAEFYQAVNRVDQGMGRLYDALEKSGHLEDTLIIFLSDNGPPFAGGKTTQYQPGANLPLIVRKPGQKAGVVNQAKVNWCDLVPTSLDWCGVTPEDDYPVRPVTIGDQPGKPRRGKKVPYTFHGRSFLPVLEQENPEGWDELFLSHTFHEITMYYPMRTLIQGDFKLIYNIANPLPYPFASDLWRSPTWQSAMNSDDKLYGQRTTYDYIQRPQFELYNLKSDGEEIQNLALKPEFAEQLEKMQQRLKQLQQETNDPWVLKWDYE